MQNEIENYATTKEFGAIFETENDVRESLAGLCSGDLYILGRLWIEAMKIVMTGSQMNMFPVVEAAPPPTPQKPPPMPYKDLGIYQAPHYEYKEYLADQDRCPAYNTKLLQNYLYPSVRDTRINVQNCYKETKAELKKRCNKVCQIIEDHKRDFKKNMRDPNNLMIRRGVVAGTSAVGYLLASGKGCPTKIVYTTLGGFAGGALCFPKESDESFRSLLFQTGKFMVCFYNMMCGKGFVLGERLPCSDDLPNLPKTKRKEQCPMPKGK